MKLMKKILSMTLGGMMAAATLFPGTSVMAATTGQTGDDWLTTKGSKIVDQNGNEVWLTGCNWFGFNTDTRMFDGIWSAKLDLALKGIADRGINFLRIPVTTQLIIEWQNGTGKKPNVNTYVNPELEGLDSLQLFDEVVRICKENGIKIMLDIHSASSDGQRHYYPLWYGEGYTVEDYYQTLEWFTERYKNEDTILAIDIENEPHGKPWHEALWAIWDDSQDDNNWKYAAEVAAKKILDINPNMLIMIEGVEAYPMEGYDYTTQDEYEKPHYYYTWWGGNLRGVKDYPVTLEGDYQKQIVYSPHDYGPTVHMQDWFKGDFTKESLYEDCWRDNWAYIMEDDIAPLLIGEWGGFLDGGKNQQWLEYLRDYIVENKINHTFWCYNPNSGDTGGLVGYDFMTWDEEKYALLEPALWQDEAGKFIGLDHEIPLGANGMTVSEYYGTSSGGTQQPEEPENPDTPEEPENPDKEVVKGDVNKDGKINSTDYAMLYRYVVNKVGTLDELALQNADVDGNGSVEANDASLIKDYVLGDIDAF